jgi:hypothetical protein
MKNKQPIKSELGEHGKRPSILGACPPISDEQRVLLEEYARSHGTEWHRELLLDWQFCRLAGPLHALRNTHGPLWLSTYVDSMNIT